MLDNDTIMLCCRCYYMFGCEFRWQGGDGRRWQNHCHVEGYVMSFSDQPSDQWWGCDVTSEARGGDVTSGYDIMSEVRSQQPSCHVITGQSSIAELWCQVRSQRSTTRLSSHSRSEFNGRVMMSCQRSITRLSCHSRSESNGQVMMSCKRLEANNQVFMSFQARVQWLGCHVMSDVRDQRPGCHVIPGQCSMVEL